MLSIRFTNDPAPHTPRISRLMHITCHTHAHNLVLTLHGTLDQPAAATASFGADHVLLSDASKTILPARMFPPHLEAFHFALVGKGDHVVLFSAVVQLHAHPFFMTFHVTVSTHPLLQAFLPTSRRMGCLRAPGGKTLFP